MAEGAHCSPSIFPGMGESAFSFPPGFPASPVSAPRGSGGTRGLHVRPGCTRGGSRGRVKGAEVVPC